MEAAAHIFLVTIVKKYLKRVLKRKERERKKRGGMIIISARSARATAH